MPHPENVESDVEMRNPVLSMRAKVFLIGACFLLGLGVVAYVEIPHYIETMRAMVEETDTPPDIESSSQANPGEMSQFVTLFMDDYDEKKYWIHWQGDKLLIPYIRNGSLFLNLTLERDDRYIDFLYGIDSPYNNYDDDIFSWLFTNMEIRLRYSDSIVDEVGEAWRHWGFLENPSLSTYSSKNWARFESWPNRLGPPIEGLYRSVEVNDTTSLFTNFHRSEIDLSEWHTYGILWEPGNVTFTVDGMRVANTNSAPSIPLEVMIAIHCRTPHRPHQSWDYYPLPYPVSIEIDYFRLYVSREYFDEMNEEIVSLIKEATDLVSDMERNGWDTNEHEETLGLAVELWSENNYFYLKSKELLESLLAVSE